MNSYYKYVAFCRLLSINSARVYLCKTFPQCTNIMMTAAFPLPSRRQSPRPRCWSLVLCTPDSVTVRKISVPHPSIPPPLSQEFSYILARLLQAEVLESSYFKIMQTSIWYLLLWQSFSGESGGHSIKPRVPSKKKTKDVRFPLHYPKSVEVS